MNDRDSLTQHLKDKKGLVATMVAIKTTNGVEFGYSKYHRSIEDKPFTRRVGRQHAMDRALGKTLKCNVPFIIKEHMPAFIDRCGRYFKDEVLLTSGIFN